MSDRLSDIEARLRQVEAAIAALTRGAPLPQPLPQGAGPAPRFRPFDIGPGVALLGRTLFVLAGAFLLRALTDSGRLGAGLGVLIGFAFAATWIGMADRSGGRGQGASASFHGVAFVLIAFPLIFEAATRFQFLTPAAAAAVLGGCTAVALAVGWRRRLQSLVWIASLGALTTATAVAIATAEVGPFAFLMMLLGVAALWLGYVLGWTLLRWPIAWFADLAIVVVSLRAVTPGAADSPGVAFTAQILLLVAYLGSFATRTLLLNRNIIPFEVVQSVAAALVGLGGAAFLTRVTSGGGLPLAVATLALSAGCYGAAAIFVERRQSLRRNYYFYTSAGLILALAGVALAMPARAVGPVYAVFGVVAASAGRWSSRGTYRAHGAVYLTAAVIVTGLIRYVVYGLGVPIVPSGIPSITMLAVLALCAVAMWGLGLRAAQASSSSARRVPRLVVLILVIGGVLGVTASWIVTQQASAAAAAPGFIATIRTALLVAGILVLALADRLWALIEGAWLVYPLLVLTGLKFLVEDVRAGQPASLFVSFALYGLALFVGPRLVRRSRKF